MMREPVVLLESFVPGEEGHSWSFSGLVEEISVHEPACLIPALQRIESMVDSGFHAAGCISYEAASAINPDLTTAPRSPFPLLWFGVYRERHPVQAGKHDAPAPASSYATSNWEPSISPDQYMESVEQIRGLIAAGDVYQVNYTFHQRFTFNGDPFCYFRDLCRVQPTPFAAYLEVGRHRVLSASPELFFRLKNGVLTARPMKGTAKRGRWHEEDREARQALRESPKDRAENLMIVDLLRNDIGIIAVTGSVQVESLFDVETLGAVHQMTSTIKADLPQGTGFVDIVRALFPCGSITGAPKRRAMEIIAELEDSPRGLYTGCIGYLSPGGEAAFSVAIRTILIDTGNGAGQLGIGSGVTHDSDPAAEYAECLAKGLFAQNISEDFSLIESLLFEEGAGYFLLSRHLERLELSAGYFNFPYPAASVCGLLEQSAHGLRGCHKVRLTLARNGELKVDSISITPDPAEPFRISFAEQVIGSGDRMIYHKTTLRRLYEEELAKKPECIDVIFCNERGEVTEGSYHNVVARIDGKLVTPPLHSGLLPGVFRAELLALGEIAEQIITRDQFRMAEEIFLINSVRRWRKATLA